MGCEIRDVLYVTWNAGFGMCDVGYGMCEM